MKKALEGDLSQFPVPDLLTFLRMVPRTGVLVLERAEQETKIFLRGGDPVFANSTKPDLRFGSLIMKLRKLSPDVLEPAFQRHLSGSFRIGQALLAEKILSEEELASFLKVQVSEVIFDTFEWNAGLFVFYEKIAPPATAVMLEMDLQNLIMEGVRRIDERRRLTEIFPSRDLIVEAVANPERVKRSVTLTPEEWKVFFLVDGRRTLDEVCRLVGHPDDMATLLILHHLVAAKFVAIVPAAVDAPPPASLLAFPPGAKAEGTQLMTDGRYPPAVGPFSVEFSPGLPSRRADDDTKEVVNPKAVQYLANVKKLTVSRLVLVKDGNETSFPLTRDSYTLGRHRNNDIVINDPKVSSFHARIDRSPEGFVLVDLKSRNGSYVNGKRFETTVLKTTDEVRLGPAKLIYKVDYTSAVT